MIKREQPDKGIDRSDFDNEDKVFNIPLDRITLDPNQPRKHFDERALNELTESIKTHGLLQPIILRPNGDGTFQIVCGERRYRAHQKAHLPSIRALITDLPDSKLSDARLTENIEREDLNPIELAREFQRRVEAGETHEQIAKSIKKSRAYVTQRLLLLKLPEEQQQEVQEGKISFADARILATKNRQKPKRDGYGVTIEELEVYRLFQSGEKPSLDVLYQAYRKDLAALRRALR